MFFLPQGSVVEAGFTPIGINAPTYNLTWLNGLSNSLGGPLNSLLGAAIGAGGGEMSAETLAMIVEALINPLFTNNAPDFLKTLNSFGLEGQALADSLKPYFSTDAAAKNAALYNDLLSIEKLQSISETALAASGGKANTENIIESFRQSVVAGTDTKAAKEAYIKKLVASGEYTYDGTNLIDSNGNSANDANNYLHGGILSTTDTPVCEEAFGVGWLSPSQGSQDVSAPEAVAATTTVACTSYTYSDWSVCSGGSQSRTIKTQSPSGCTDTSSAALTQSCTGTACTSYVYSDWSACANNQQTRSIVSRTPAGCDTSSAVFTQACTVVQVPTISNLTTAIQTGSSPVLAVTTNRAAACQFNYAGGFSYGAGTTFDTTGGYNHNTILANAAAGAKIYYVVCKDNATGGVSDALKIEFKVNASDTDSNCVALSSNDRQNDDDRTGSGDDDEDSSYPWRSAEAGTRESFSKVDWYAGYQFTPDQDGYVTQLCGYFDEGFTNRVSLFNGSYTEIAAAQVAGKDGWKCVNISPVAVVADKRYYVIARIEDGPVYFEYKSGLLPRDTGEVVIEAGIRQLGDSGDFKTGIVKYDYMVLGLVDIKITFKSTSTDGPEVSSISPTGTVKSSSATLSVQTEENATCKFDRDDVEYAEMKYTFGLTGAKSHEQKVCGLEDGSYSFYVRCKSADGEVNNGSTVIQFNISK